MADDAALVSLADKLHNARKIMLDLREEGESVWGRFKVEKGETLWYYRSLATAFRARLPGHVLAGELESTVEEMGGISNIQSHKCPMSKGRVGRGPCSFLEH
jgi:hypothetical protein